MKIELELEEARELIVFLIERMSKDAKLTPKDTAALRKWRTTLKPGADVMREFTAKVNYDLARVLETQRRSPIMKPDWQ